VKVAEDGEGQGSEIRQIDAADSFQEKRTVVEAAIFFVGQGEDKATEQEEEDDGLMSGSEETQWSAIDEVDDAWRADFGEVMEDNGQRSHASQGVQLVKAPEIALLRA